MEYVDKTIPAYGFWAPNRPTSSGGKKAYQDALADAARKEINKPITTNDIELEVLYVTTAPAAETLDVDNVGKPTLDALKGVVYLDDRQVRAVRIVKFDKSQPIRISGRIGPLKAIWWSDNSHAVWIWVYSYSRSMELKKKFGFRRPNGWEIHILLGTHDPTKKAQAKAVAFSTSSNTSIRRTRPGKKKEG